MRERRQDRQASVPGEKLSLAPPDTGPADQPGLAHRPERGDRGAFPAPLHPSRMEQGSLSFPHALQSITPFPSCNLSSGSFVELPSLPTLLCSRRSRGLRPEWHSHNRAGEGKAWPMSQSTAVSQLHPLGLRHRCPGLHGKQMGLPGLRKSFQGRRQSLPSWVK